MATDTHDTAPPHNAAPPTRRDHVGAPEQRVTLGALSTIADVANERDQRSPAVIVVGDAAAMADV